IRGKRIAVAYSSTSAGEEVKLAIKIPMQFAATSVPKSATHAARTHTRGTGCRRKTTRSAGKSCKKSRTALTARTSKTMRYGEREPLADKERHVLFPVRVRRANPHGATPPP